MTGMQASLSRARHPALFLTTWLVSTVVGCTVAFVAVALMPRTLAKLGPGRESAALVTMAILVVIVELRPIMMSRFEGDPISIAPAFVFATLYLWGPWYRRVTLMAGVGPPQRSPGAQGSRGSCSSTWATTPCPSSLHRRS